MPYIDTKFGRLNAETKIIKKLYGNKDTIYYEREYLIQCPECKKQRWVSRQNLFYSFKSLLCFSCSNKNNATRMNEVREIKTGKDHHNWKGGRRKNDGGYILIRIYADNQFFPMAGKQGHIREHRLIMAQHLNRLLEPWEIVHHTNGIRDDNRIENLEIIPDRNTHTIIKKLQNENEKLKHENLKLLELLNASNGSES